MNVLLWQMQQAGKDMAYCFGTTIVDKVRYI